jgi:hypothetical protein
MKSDWYIYMFQQRAPMNNNCVWSASVVKLRKQVGYMEEWEFITAMFEETGSLQTCVIFMMNILSGRRL